MIFQGNLLLITPIVILMEIHCLNCLKMYISVHILLYLDDQIAFLRCMYLKFGRTMVSLVRLLYSIYSLKTVHPISHTHYTHTRVGSVYLNTHTHLSSDCLFNTNKHCDMLAWTCVHLYFGKQIKRCCYFDLLTILKY